MRATPKAEPTATGSGRQWPPAVEPISTRAPVLSPAEALRTFSMPAGYRLELVASEPLIQDPIAIDWDPAGRLWAIELPGYISGVAVRCARGLARVQPEEPPFTASLPEADTSLLRCRSQEAVLAAQHEPTALCQLEVGGVVHR